MENSCSRLVPGADGQARAWAWVMDEVLFNTHFICQAAENRVRDEGAWKPGLLKAQWRGCLAASPKAHVCGWKGNMSGDCIGQS